MEILRISAQFLVMMFRFFTSTPITIVIGLAFIAELLIKPKRK